MAACLICLGVTRGRESYHPRCLNALFGSAQPPTIDFDLAGLHTIALEMAGRMSISGVQRKVSVRLSADGSRIEPATRNGRYILKPQGTYPNIPENEHVTMRMAGLVGIQTPPFGLVRLKDKSLAYIVKRFDRTDQGEKLRQEDFCQLAKKPPQDKYEGSAELCARIVRKYANEPLIEIRKLYQLLLFSWWTCNMDMHLKNFTLLASADGIFGLSPAYDQVCTHLVIPDDRLAIPMGGRDKTITKPQWLRFADYCELPRRAAEGIITRQCQALTRSKQLITRSFLPEKMKENYSALIMQRCETLSTR